MCVCVCVYLVNDFLLVGVFLPQTGHFPPQGLVLTVRTHTHTHTHTFYTCISVRGMRVICCWCMHVCVSPLPPPSLFHGDDLGVDVLLLAPHVLHVSQDLGHVVRADLQVLLLQTGHLGDHRARLAR